MREDRSKLSSRWRNSRKERQRLDARFPDRARKSVIRFPAPFATVSRCLSNPNGRLTRGTRETSFPFIKQTSAIERTRTRFSRMRYKIEVSVAEDKSVCCHAAQAVKCRQSSRILNIQIFKHSLDYPVAFAFGEFHIRRNDSFPWPRNRVVGKHRAMSPFARFHLSAASSLVSCRLLSVAEAIIRAVEWLVKRPVLFTGRAGLKSRQNWSPPLGRWV